MRSNKKRFHHQALVEIRILDHLRRRDKDGLHNVIHMLDYFYFRSHLCISFELLRSVPRRSSDDRRRLISDGQRCGGFDTNEKSLLP